MLPLRGNVNTRLAKLQLGQFDAIVLACAGLERLGMAERIAEQFAPEIMLPAAAQGVVGVECLEHHSELRDVLSQLQHADTATTTLAERAVAHALQANCQSPVASFATRDDTGVSLDALVASEDGTTVLREQAHASNDTVESLGSKIAERLLARGAGELLGE